VVWPKGKSRKPQPEAELIDATEELLDTGAVKSKAPQTKAKEAKPQPNEDVPSKPKGKWTVAKSDELLAKVENFEPDDWRDRSHDDLMSLPAETHEWLREQGLVAQWCTVSVLGQQQQRRFTQMQMNGWTPVQPGEIPGISETLVDGTSQLCARSKTIHDRARKAQREASLAPLNNRAAMIIEGVPNVTGADHPSATRGWNKIRKTVERIEVPRDD